MKKKSFFSLMFCLISLWGIGQNNERLQKTSELSYTNIQDNKEIEKCEIKFVENDDKSTNVHVDFYSIDAVNPYECSYKYKIKKEANAISMDLAAIINPMEFYVDPSISQIYQGQQLIFPQDLSIGQKLEDCTGTFFNIKENWKMAANYVSTERTVVGKEKITLNGKEIEVFLIASKLETTKIMGDKIVFENTEILTEWFSPEIGILKIDRESEMEKELNRERETRLDLNN